MDGALGGHDLGRTRRALRAPAARPQPPARVPQRRKRRDHPHRSGAGDDVAAGAGGALATSLTAALLHTLNHAAFKGPVPRRGQRPRPRTHVRNMENSAGSRRMPWQRGCFSRRHRDFGPSRSMVSSASGSPSSPRGRRQPFHGPAGLVIVFRGDARAAEVSPRPASRRRQRHLPRSSANAMPSMPGTA